MRWCEMCVSHRHLDRLITHQFSHCAKVDAGHHQAARKCVPQAVPSEEADARLANCRVEPVFVALQRPPCILTKTRPLPTGACEQILKCRLRNRVQRNVPSVPVLALRDRNELTDEINPAPNQTVLFARPHARVQSNLKLGHVGWIVGQDHGAQS